MVRAALALVLALAATPAAAGEWRKGDLVTFAVACQAPATIEAWAERWARADPKSAGLLKAAIETHACFYFSWAQNGALIEPVGPIYRNAEGRGRQAWRVYAFHQSVYVAFDPDGGPHTPAVELPQGQVQR